MPRKSELTEAVAKLDIKCDELTEYGVRLTKSQSDALIRLARNVVTEFYSAERRKDA